MKIKSLNAPQFKGADISHTFQPIVLIVGENFEGKSAITDAITVGLYGCLPSLGDTTASTFSLSSNPKEMFVRVSFDDDTANAIALSRDESGSIKSKRDTAYELPRVLIDAGEYLYMTEEKRLKYVLERVNVKKCGYDESAFHDRLFMACPEIALADQAEIFKRWGEEWKKSVRQRENTNTSIIEWMDALLLRLKNAKSETDRQLKSSRQQLKNDETSLREPPENVAAKREAAQKALVAAKAKLDTKKDTRLKDLEHDLDNAKTEECEALETVEVLENSRTKMEKLKCCPTCKADGTDWLKPWLKVHKAELAAAQALVTEKSAAVKKLKAEHDKLAKQPIDKARKALSDAVESAQDEYDRLDELHLKYISYQRDSERLKQTQEDVKTKTVELSMLKHMIDQLVEYQTSLVAKAFDVLLKRARRFTDDLLRGSLVYHEGKIGYWVTMAGMNQHFVSHKTFSGTEKLLAYAGLQVALAQESPIKFVIFDEMGRVHKKLKELVVERLEELIDAGDLDQAFLIDTSSEHYGSFVKNKTLQLIEVQRVS